MRLFTYIVVSDKGFSPNPFHGWCTPAWVMVLLLVAMGTVVGAEAGAGRAYGVIAGRVVDSSDGAGLPLATVNLSDGLRVIKANGEGEFRFEGLQAGRYALRVTHVGYSSKTVQAIDVEEGDTVKILVELVVKPRSVRSIVVTPGSYSIADDAPSASQTVSREEIVTTPQLGEDFFRAVEHLPGISGNDFSARIEVRGGENEEVLVLLDGMEIQEPFHIKDLDGGAVSAIDVAAIGGVDVMTGGYAAKYGGKMSGVFDIRSRSMSGKKARLSAAASLTSVRGMSEGSFGGGRGAWLLSARRGFMDLMMKVARPEDEITPRYYDVFGKVSYKLGEKQVVYFDVFSAQDNLRWYGTDEVDANDTTRTKYSNSYAWVGLNSEFHPKLLVRSIVSVGYVSHDRQGLDYHPDYARLEQSVSDGEESKFAGFTSDWQYQVANDLMVEFGVNARVMEAEYTYLHQEYFYGFIPDPSGGHFGIIWTDTTQVGLDPSGRQYGSYVSGRFRLGNRFTGELGMRYDYASYTGDEFTSPRVAGAFDLGQRTTLRGAWGIYRQVEEINEISVEDGEDGFYPAQKAEQYDLGLEHKFSEGAEVRVEGYLKKYSDLRPDYRNYQDRLDLFPEIRFDRQVVYRNGSVARGIELVAKRDVGGMFSWYTSLALAEVKDDVWAIYSPDAQYTTIYNRTMSSPRDLRYTCHASLNYRPDESWLIGLAFQYHSGWPYTELIHVHMDMGNGYYADYFKQGEQWASRYPAYHRLDLRVNRYIPMGRGRMSLFVEVLNLYARKNQRAYTYETNPGSPNSRVWATTPYDHWLGFTPSAGISYEVGW